MLFRSEVGFDWWRIDGWGDGDAMTITLTLTPNGKTAQSYSTQYSFTTAEASQPLTWTPATGVTLQLTPGSYGQVLGASTNDQLFNGLLSLPSGYSKVSLSFGSQGVLLQQAVMGLGSGSVQYYANTGSGGSWQPQLAGTGWDSTINTMAVNWQSSSAPQVVAGLGNSAVEYYNGSSWNQLHDNSWDTYVNSMAVNWQGSSTPQVVVGLGDSAVEYYNGSSWTELHNNGWASNAQIGRAHV